MSFQRTRFVLILALIALLLRLAAVLLLRDIHSGPTRAFGADGIEYDLLGSQVAAGNGYVWEPGHPTAFRAPGFPLLLSAIYRIAGHRFPPVYFLFCLLGAATCVLTYCLVKEVGGESLARLAGILSVIYIPHIYFATAFETEILFAFCLGLCTWLLLVYLRSGSYWLLIVAGLVLGWGFLTRPFSLLLLPLFMTVLLWHRRNFPAHQRRLAAPVLLAATSLAVIIPWTARNYEVFHKFVLVATNGGSTFYGGNNDLVVQEPRLYGGWVSTGELPNRKLIDAEPDEVSHDKMEWHLGLLWVRSHLTAVPKLLVYKFIRLWLPDINSGNKKYVALQLAFYTPFLLLFGLSMVSLQKLRYRTAPWMLMHGIVLATVLTGLVFWGSPRFRDANTPVLMAYAAMGLQVVSAWCGRSNWVCDAGELSESRAPANAVRRTRSPS